VFGAFQEETYYRRSEPRWRELARGADAALVFADFEAPTRAPAAGPVEVSLSARAPMRREWAVVCDSPGFTAVLTAWELPGQRGVADADRLFESIWTIEPGPVRDAARICARVAHEAGVPEAEDVRRALAADPERLPDPTSGGALLHRVLAYVDRGA
jgi:DICT domain-containing protein